jgi:Peptidase M76 family
MLEGMGAKKTEERDFGFQFQVPRKTMSPSQKWHQIQNDASDESYSLQNPMIATSAWKRKDYEKTNFLDHLNIICRPCASDGVESRARAFVTGPTPFTIVLCSNKLSYHNSREVEEVLVHELIHTYDVLVNELDLQDCENLAYSEIRAARDAECKDAWLGGHFCIPNQAHTATANMFSPQEARACLAKVMEKALADKVPLERKNQAGLDKPSQNESCHSSSFAGNVEQSQR